MMRFRLPTKIMLSKTVLASAALVAGLAANPAAAAITADDDPILFWNETMLALFPGGPPVQTRGYAMVNIAMYDAVNAALGNPYHAYLHGVGATGGDTRAAASKAAHDVLVALDPDPARGLQYDAALAANLALVPDGAAKTAGLANGAAHAAAILANRAGDGSAPAAPYAGGTAPGQWRPTPPGLAGGVFADWGNVKPFVMTSGDQFRPGPPPALDSVAYAAAYDEVKRVGSAGAEALGDRTADQTASALFWDTANGGTWLRVGLIVAEDESFDTLGFARSFAILTTSLADAAIAGFDTKYTYKLWRPVTAIREGNADTNDLTVGDPNWQSLFPAPAHPSYLSTHSILSAAGAETLIALFGDTQGFTFSIGPDTRSFTSLAQAEQDAADSRLWGGIHFRFDNEAGLAAGEAIGRWVLDGRAFTAVPEPGSWMMMIAGFGLIGGLSRRQRTLAVATC